MERSIDPEQLRNKIKKLPFDKPLDRIDPKGRSQKEHWLGWLYKYNNIGRYRRVPGTYRDAKWVYNHIVCPDLLIYLARAIQIQPDLLTAAEQAYHEKATEMHRSAEIRKIMPWSMVYAAFFEKEEPTFLQKIFKRSN